MDDVFACRPVSHKSGGVYTHPLWVNPASLSMQHSVPHFVSSPDEWSRCMCIYHHYRWKCTPLHLGRPGPPSTLTGKYTSVSSYRVTVYSHVSTMTTCTFSDDSGRKQRVCALFSTLRLRVMRRTVHTLSIKIGVKIFVSNIVSTLIVHQ
jgi:hypothetical protein